MESGTAISSRPCTAQGWQRRGAAHPRALHACRERTRQGQASDADAAVTLWV